MNYAVKIDDFRNKKTWAVLGNVHDHSKYAYKIFKFLKNKGYEVYAIDPTGLKVDEEKTYTTLNELPTKIEALDVVINPKVSKKYIDEALNMGIDHIWFQPGAMNGEAYLAAIESGASVVKEDCVMMEF